MSLFSTIQSSANALQVNQIGLQVVGNNIANVNTPGYIRQELVQGAASGYRKGDLVLGMGVQALAIEQRVDNYLLERMRTTGSQLAYYDALSAANGDVESYLNELTSSDISSKMSDLAAAFQDVANQPGNEAFRQLLIDRGSQLASQIQTTAKNVQDASSNSALSLKVAANDINNLADTIAKLNVRIVELEAGSNSAAVGLRDERIKALDELSAYVNISTQEQPSGSVSVFIGGDYLVTDGLTRPIKIVESTTPQGPKTEVRFLDNDASLNVSSGKLRAFLEGSNAASDSSFMARLDNLAMEIITTVNRIHSQGQGMIGFDMLMGESTIRQADAPLELSNPNFRVENGSFEIKVTNDRTKQTQTYLIPVVQLGTSNDTTANQLVSQISEIDGLVAEIDSDGKFIIRSEQNDISFGFANDSSGVLAALGLNTFFTGDSAITMGIRKELQADPRLLAASNNGIGNGANNAILLAEAFTKPQASLGGKNLNEIYDSFVTATTLDAASQQSATDGLRNFYQTLESKHLGISGVNLDEEAVKMMLYQRAFQAQSRVISVASELLETLVNII